MCIAITGGFSVLAITKSLIYTAKHRHDRPRDFQIKRAGENKIASLIENGLSMHPVQQTTKGQIMRNFFLRGEEVIEVGGLSWTYKQVLNGHLFLEEGVRFSGRIFVGQVAQVVVTLIGVVFGFRYVEDMGDFSETARAMFNRNWTQSDAQNVSTREWATYSQADITITEEEVGILKTIPEKWCVFYRSSSS